MVMFTAVSTTVVMKFSRTFNFIGSCQHEALLIVLGPGSIVTIFSANNVRRSGELHGHPSSKVVLSLLNRMPKVLLVAVM